MAIELRMRHRESIFHGENPFFIDTCPVTMQPSSVVISQEKWRELGQPEHLIVILEDAHRDDRTDTSEIPVITGESEVIHDELVVSAYETIPRPAPHARR